MEAVLQCYRIRLTGKRGKQGKKPEQTVFKTVHGKEENPALSPRLAPSWGHSVKCLTAYSCVGLILSGVHNYMFFSALLLQYFE